MELFNRSKAGHLTSYVYFEGGYFDQLTKIKEYYISSMEATLVNNQIHELQRYLVNISHILELGAGCQSAVITKTIPLLKMTPYLKSYTAVDISVRYAITGRKLSE